MQKKLALLLIASLIFLGQPATYAATTFGVNTTQFNIELNGVEIDNDMLPYPLVLYKDITYFPMTWDFSKLMGLNLTYSQASGLGISQGSSNENQNLALNASAKHITRLSASVVNYPVTINGVSIDNTKETYPLLNINGITYFPLTWKYAVDYFNWQYQFTLENGLDIAPKVTSSQTVTDNQDTTTNTSSSTGYEDTQNFLPLMLGSSLPLSYNSLTEVPTSFVRDQGQTSTCWAFAANSAFEIAIYKKTGMILNFSEDHLILNAPIPVTYDSGGYFNIAAAYYSNGTGPVLESLDPYGDGLTNLDAISNYQIASYVSIENDIKGTKKAIMTYGSAIASINFSDEGYELYSTSTHSYYNNDEDLGPSHEFVLVGWDDNYSVNNFKVKPSSPGAFIAMNSWGTSWGDSGYFYISYEDVNILDDVYAITDFTSTKEFKTIYNYNPTGITRYEGYVDFNKATGVNYFTALADESLYAVSFYVPEAYTKYTVSLDLDGDNQIEITPSVTGYMGTKGYYTVYLPESFDLASGQEFGVAITLENDNTMFLLPVEAPYPNIGYTVTGNWGESFLSPDPDQYDFTDLSDHLENGNLGIRAFTR